MIQKTDQDLQSFLKSQGIPPQQWDLLLFGDGSATNWKKSGSYCTFMIDAVKNVRAFLLGGQSATTVNRMELRAYADALGMHFYSILGGKYVKSPYRVIVFSDSEYTVKCGNKDNDRKANLDLWSLIDWFETRGYRIKWCWLPRNSSPMHKKADELAGKLRVAFAELHVEDTELYNMLPGSAEVPVKVALINCTECNAPMTLTEHVCPQCGRSRE